ncbi:S-adenosyl-L-methionine-dependent methyltransferase [Zopfochytrium polystomum]|nr:S-adenosyl-L-methionine-dependent methyltransferase [Zopfochytrium polystomum]
MSGNKPAVVWAVVALLALAGAAASAAQLSLSPVFGAIPAAAFHRWIVALVVSLAAVTPVRKPVANSKVPSKNAGHSASSSHKDITDDIAEWHRAADIAAAATAFTFVSPIGKSLLFPFSGTVGVVYGPAYTECILLAPILVCCVRASVVLLNGHYRLSSPFGAAVYVAVCSPAVIAAESAISLAVSSVIGSHPAFSRVGLELTLAAASSVLLLALHWRSNRRVNRKRWRVFIVVAGVLTGFFHGLWLNPHFPSSHALEMANTALRAYNVSLLARQESLTGYVSVLQVRVDGGKEAFRVMRCDHSLLGGEWLPTAHARKKGQTQRETVFSAFVLLEAVRLIEHPAKRELAVAGTGKSALTIGLGIGTATNALIAHGIATTIVEVDPAVYRFAKEYFGLAKNHTAIIADAAAFVAERALASRRSPPSPPPSFDYIVHDVFTGGAEPVQLFTIEFLTDLRTLLTEDGSVAINYAGDATLPASRLILNTIYAAFDGRCRTFRDAPPSPPPPQSTSSSTNASGDVSNMVVFCINGPREKKVRHTTAGAPFTFRAAVPADFLGSISRRRYLQPQASLEIPIDYQREAAILNDNGDEEAGGEFARESGESAWRRWKVLRRDNLHEVERFHLKNAAIHWHIMRTVLPDGVWELW